MNFSGFATPIKHEKLKKLSTINANPTAYRQNQIQRLT